MIEPATARFLSLVSHEFRTPLTVIQSSCDLLESYGERWESERRVAHCRRIQTAVSDMIVLLENTSLLASFDAQGYMPAPEPLSPGPFLDGVLEEFRSATAGREVGSSWEPAATGFRVDQRLLHAAVSNLLANALRFSSGPVEIRIGTADGDLVLRVLDRGDGVLPGDRDRIWQPFERGTGSAGIPGVGLGLAIVARGAALCGGSASLRDREDGGTEAVLRIRPAEAE